MAWYHRLLNVVRSGRLGRDLDREISFHLAERSDALVDAGTGPDEAAREARRRFGNPTVHKERARDADVTRWLEAMAADVRYALRALRASPGFTFVAVLSLALGIGANTAIFGLTNSLVLKALPVRDPEGLLQVTLGDERGAYWTNPLWEQLRDHATSLQGAFAYGGQTINLADGGEARPANGAYVSGAFFTSLGVRAIAGRLLQPADDFRGCPGVATVSAGFAERTFGNAEAAVGRAISLNGHPYEVTGVADPAFFGVEVGRRDDVYVPICSQAIELGPNSLDARSRWYLEVMARAGNGLSVERVRAALRALAPASYTATLPPNWSTAQQESYLKGTFDVLPAATGFSSMRKSYGRALITLMVVVGLVLLIACANIANLLLARGAARRHEIAIRLAIGASRGRVLRQLVTESLVLSLAGAAVGAVFAQWASHLLVGFLSTKGKAVYLDLAVDVRVLLFTGGIAVLTGLLFGMVPAWRASRVDPQVSMKAAGRGIVDADARHRAGRVLVIGQVALSLALVAAAGLLLGSFRTLATLNPGFRRHGVLLANTSFKNEKLAPAAQRVVQDAILDELRLVPGVEAAGAAVLTPVGNTMWNQFVEVPGYTPEKQDDALVWMNQVSDGYLSALGTPLLTGRDITPGEGPGTPQVAVINQAMAHRFFGAANPVGRTFRLIDGRKTSTPFEVIGVAADAKYQRLTDDAPPTAYFPFGQGDELWSQITFVVRGNGDPTALEAAVTSIVGAHGASISLRFTTIDEQLAASLTRPRLLASLSAFFGGLALLLAMIGLYGTMSYTVTRRRNEIGIRVALGAVRARVVSMVIGEALVLIVIGIALGLVLALATTRLVQAFLFGLTPTDPVTLAGAALLLTVVAVAASVIPALRAARLDPMDALRQD